MLKLLIIISSFLITNITVALANCNFVSGNFIEKLKNPKSINSIEIKVPKSSNYVKNFYKIITSDTKIIEPKLKKKFNAEIKIKYNFGECVYNGKVRQHGDFKDHIDFEKGIRSLDVTLTEGNVLNAVRFKLLIPKTRYDLNEIIGSLILKDLGFISPETFQVKSKVNNSESIMLFQEVARKELLEKNNRREGPIFEGDEKLIWGYKNYDNFDLEKLSLSRVTNKNWFLKGKNSEFITLKSYSILQHAYLDYSQNVFKNSKFAIFPNKKNTESNVFNKYSFIMLAMNGKHGLRPHNRKFYYNSFSNEFEPIYYDGNLKIQNKLLINQSELSHIFPKNYYFEDVVLFSDSDFKDNLLKKFINRVIISEKKTKKYFQETLKIIEENSIKLNDEIRKIDFDDPEKIKDYSNLLNNYIKQNLQKKLNQEIIVKFEDKSKNYIAYKKNGETQNFTSKEVAQIISNNKFKKKRLIFLPENDNYSKSDDGLEYLDFKNGEIIKTKNLVLNINKKNRTIQINQNFNSDWILFKNIRLENWKVIFNGTKKFDNTKNINSGQRFNKNGLTGCVNFYQVSFDFTNFIINDGNCEDSINIVSSSGKIDDIKIKDASSDALDVDFSKLNIKSVNISNSGNDCIDLSNGNYIIEMIDAKNCNDKAISVGEKSNLTIKKMYLKSSDIGISTKDSSIAKIEKAELENLNYCYEVTKKKQEFSGGNLSFKNLKCEGKKLVDKNSIIFFK